MILKGLLRRLIKVGRLVVIDATGERHVFEGTDGPKATVRLHSRSLEYLLLLRPQFYAGEAYMDGTLTLEEGSLYNFLNLITINTDTHQRNDGVLDRWNPFFGPLAWFGRMMGHLRRYNPIPLARRNVAHHYDLSGDLYELFLDKDRQYSCAYFTDPTEDLETAQENKKRHIAAKLLIEPGQKVLDIGSGWGGLALYLARETGAHVTGITLSTEQLKISRQRAIDEGLEDRTQFEFRDYREQTGTFDRIVSVGMFEHVGAGHCLEFFNDIKKLLADDGIALLHTIGRTEGHGTANPWIRKYIFPGIHTPALSELAVAVEKAGLIPSDVEILRLHYAETLRHWRHRFLANRAKAAALYDEKFCRMWEFYLAGCEVSFRHMDNVVFQVQLVKHQDSVPLTRDYISAYENAHHPKHGGKLQAGAVQNRGGYPLRVVAGSQEHRDP